MNKYEIRVIPKYDVSNKIYWTVFFPEIEECIGCGNSIEEAISEAEENLEFYLEYLKDEKLPIMKIYNKLARDKIPEIIAGDNGKTCITRIMADDEYLESLNTKMQEELKEYLESGDVEELADLEEVLRAILDAKGVSYEEFEKIRNRKVEKRGAFKKKIFLESISEKD